MNLTQDEIKEIKIQLVDNRKYLIFLRKELNSPKSVFMEKDIMSNIRTTEILINQLETFLQYS